MGGGSAPWVPVQVGLCAEQGLLPWQCCLFVNLVCGPSPASSSPSSGDPALQTCIC